MTGKKISESIKNDIIHLYKHTGETTSTLAERYGVSNSTISRMLKSTLPEQEYEVLIASKRAARVPGTETKQVVDAPSEELEPVKAPQPQVELKSILRLEETSPTPTPIIKRRTVSNRAEKLLATDEPNQIDATVAETGTIAERSAKSDYPERSAKSDYPERSAKGDYPERSAKGDYPERSAKGDYPERSAKGDRISAIMPQTPEINVDRPISKPIPSPLEQPVTNSANFPIDEETNAMVAEMLGEDMLQEAEDSEGLEDEDLDYLDDDDEPSEPTRIVKRRSSSNALIQVLPLSEANLPKTCYLVIDRLSELITRPLKEFGDLGQIPTQETNQKTLPVFDNHRVARRFSTKRDRVIKVPDSRMFHKACPHLQAKGITRLLVDGQVYSLYPN